MSGCGTERTLAIDVGKLNGDSDSECRAGMTSGDAPSRSEHYRGVADSLRRLARQTRYFEIRQDLVDLADRFDRMAEFSAKWHSLERDR